MNSDAATIPGRPADWSDRSYYLAMRDGVRLAVSLYFPGRMVPKTPVPVLLIQTRYGRAGARKANHPRSIGPWLDAGYVAAVIDVRGSTASFGARTAELGPEEQRDMDEIIAHVAGEPWSNGKVIATGVSYTANTADIATTRPSPALVAALPRQTDFDFWELFWPGGIFNRTMFVDWMSGIFEIDFGRPRTRMGALVVPSETGLDGRASPADCLKMFPVLQPVDDDPDATQLNHALRGREQLHPHWTIADYDEVRFRDDVARNGSSFFAACTGSLMEAVRRERKPVQYWGSWIDCNTAEGALNRWRSAPEVPGVVIITANTHVGDERADPFLPDVAQPMPTIDEQNRLHLAFAAEVLGGALPARMIRYYVLGAGIMRETKTWPPDGVETICFALAARRRLEFTTPESTSRDSYDVDPEASSGVQNRWCWISRPRYPDRREADARLLTYDSAPMEKDMELAGWPVATLRLATQSDDPQVFLYLEDVAPDGRVTYITEGMIRAVNRRLADAASLPYDPGPAPHSYRRADVLPVVPGEPFTLSLKLFATAALIREGHRLRLAIAGADRDTFAPAVTRDRFDLYLGGEDPSRIEVPLRPWRAP